MSASCRYRGIPKRHKGFPLLQKNGIRRALIPASPGEKLDQNFCQERYQKMNTTLMEASAPQLRDCVPLPWQALYEFGRQICVGCAVTFGPRSAYAVKPAPMLSNDVPQIKLVLISGGRETEPLTRKLPRTAFEPQVLAVLIADAIAEAVTGTGG
jgi:hypothetical protein